MHQFTNTLGHHDKKLRPIPAIYILFFLQSWKVYWKWYLVLRGDIDIAWCWISPRLWRDPFLCIWWKDIQIQVVAYAVSYIVFYAHTTFFNSDLNKYSWCYKISSDPPKKLVKENIMKKNLWKCHSRIKEQWLRGKNAI